MRASDADREAAVERLRAHAAEGRLDVDELEQRVERALAARTVGELEELQRDLPAAGRGSRRVARAKEEFRSHLTTYLACQIGFVVIWALTGAGYPWFVWPMFGWGIGVACHAASVRGVTRARARRGARPA